MDQRSLSKEQRRLASILIKYSIIRLSGAVYDIMQYYYPLLDYQLARNRAGLNTVAPSHFGIQDFGSLSQRSK